MTGSERRRREAVLYEVAMRSRRRAQRQFARRAAAMRAAAALRLAATANQRDRPSS